jgi:hypothetical protein
MGVPTKIGFFFWGFEVTYLSFSRVLNIMMYLFLPKVSPFARYGGMKFQGGWIDEGTKGSL